MTKQDEIMYKIIREIVSDKRKKGDTFSVPFALLYGKDCFCV